MKNYFVILCLFIVSACGQTGEYGYDPFAAEKKKEKPTLKLTLVPQESLAVGKPSVVFAKLTTLSDQLIVTDADLETAHTHKFHLLIADPTLTHFQHMHPEPSTTPGLYSFTLTPRFDSYRAWADVIPLAKHKLESVRADLGNVRGIAINKVEIYKTNIENYHFMLSFDTPPTKDKISTGTITITDTKNKPITLSEPQAVSEQIVGIYDDFRTLIHTRPAAESHESPLKFQIEPVQAGFIKLFAQIKINGKEIYVPFGIVVR